MKLLVVCLTLGTWCLARVAGRDPGIKLQITQYGVNYAASEFAHEGVSGLVNQQIPDVKGTTDTSLGDVDYELKEMVITSISLPTTSVTFESEQIQALLSDLGISISGKWHYKLHSFIPVSDGDSFDASLTNGQLSMSVALGINGTKITVTPTSCNADMGNLDIHIHGSTGFIYEWLIDQFKDDIKDMGNKAVCDALEDYVRKVSLKLQEQPVVFPITDTLTADLSLLRAPDVSKTAVSADLKGEFFWKDNFTESSLNPGKMSGEADPKKMVNAWATAYSLNTLAEVSHNNGLLSFNFSRDDLPDSNKDTLNTTCPGELCFGNMIPELGEVFPNSTVGINITSLVAPVTNISPARIQVQSSMMFNFFVQLNNGSSAHAFRTKNDISLEAILQVSLDKVTASFLKFSANSTVEDSSIGDITDGQMTYVLDVVGDNLVLPLLNTWGSQGFPIPGDGHVTVAHQNITLTENTIVASTDVLYQPRQPEVKTQLLFTPKQQKSTSKQPKSTPKQPKWIRTLIKRLRGPMLTAV